jgi:hypothetical protein
MWHAPEKTAGRHDPKLARTNNITVLRLHARGLIVGAGADLYSRWPAGTAESTPWVNDQKRNGRSESTPTPRWR